MDLPQIPVASIPHRASAVSKTNTILTLAVAAVPAIAVIYILVMAFLGSFESMPGMLKGVVALTLLCCAVVVLLPVYAALGGAKSPKAPKLKKEAVPAEAAAATEEADIKEADVMAAEEEFIEEEVAAEQAEEEDLFAAGDDEEFDYLEEERPKKK